MVISTLKAATRKRTRKVISNSKTGQYAGSISPDHSQGQYAGGAIGTPWGRQTHQQVSSQDYLRYQNFVDFDAVYISSLEVFKQHFLRIRQTF